MKIIQRLSSLTLALVLILGIFAVQASASMQTVHGIGFVTAVSLRLRDKPNTDSNVLTSAPKNDCVVILAKDGDWYKVNYNLQEGYMHQDYLRVSQVENAELGYGKITGRSVNLRTGPSTSASIAAVSTKGEQCCILGLNHGWYKIIYKDQICYIRSDYLALTEIPYENKASDKSPKYFRLGKSTGALPSNSTLKSKAGSTPTHPVITGAQILVEVQKYLGTPYLSGGATPAGFDCSGLVYYVLRQLSCSPYRTPADQLNHGTEVSKAQLLPGDLVFFAGTGARGISHVGIYAGGGQFIHAPNSRSTVSYSSLTSGYWAEHYSTARRIR